MHLRSSPVWRLSDTHKPPSKNSLCWTWAAKHKKRLWQIAFSMFWSLVAEMRLSKVLLLRSRIFQTNSNLMSYEICSLIKVAALIIAELTNCLKLKNTESQDQFLSRHPQNSGRSFRQLESGLARCQYLPQVMWSAGFKAFRRSNIKSKHAPLVYGNQSDQWWTGWTGTAVNSRPPCWFPWHQPIWKASCFDRQWCPAWGWISTQVVRKWFSPFASCRDS